MGMSPLPAPLCLFEAIKCDRKKMQRTPNLEWDASRRSNSLTLLIWRGEPIVIVHSKDQGLVKSFPGKKGTRRSHKPSEICTNFVCMHGTWNVDHVVSLEAPKAKEAFQTELFISFLVWNPFIKGNKNLGYGPWRNNLANKHKTTKRAFVIIPAFRLNEWPLKTE